MNPIKKVILFASILAVINGASVPNSQPQTFSQNYGTRTLPVVSSQNQQSIGIPIAIVPFQPSETGAQTQPRYIFISPQLPEPVPSPAPAVPAIPVKTPSPVPVVAPAAPAPAPAAQPNQPKPSRQYVDNFQTPHLSKSEIRDDAGQVATSYATSDGTQVYDRTYLKLGPKGNYIPVRYGRYQYISPEGVPVAFEYFADETGYHVKGSPLPIAPGVSSGQEVAPQ